MKDTPEDVLEAFELWMCETMGYPPEDMIFQDARNCYADYSTHLAYSAWKAGKADLLERLARPVSNEDAYRFCKTHRITRDEPQDYEVLRERLRLESYRASLLGDGE